MGAQTLKKQCNKDCEYESLLNIIDKVLNYSKYNIGEKPKKLKIVEYLIYKK